MAALRWLARGEDDVPADLNWLSDPERARAAAMRFRKRRSEFVLARWAAKHALSAVLELPATAETFATLEVRPRPTGAPAAHVAGRPAPVALSMSDRAGWAVCVVAPDGLDVGCDLELVEPRSAAFVSDWLTDAERVAVAAAPDQPSAYLTANLVWSAKESALKVLQTGLRRDTRSVEVSFPVPPWAGTPGWAALSVRAREGREFTGWWRRYGEFVLTVAAAEPAPPPVSIESPPRLAAAVASHSWLDAPL